MAGTVEFARQMHIHTWRGKENKILGFTDI